MRGRGGQRGSHQNQLQLLGKGLKMRDRWNIVAEMCVLLCFVLQNAFVVSSYWIACCVLVWGKGGAAVHTPRVSGMCAVTAAVNVHWTQRNVFEGRYNAWSFCSEQLCTV
jgi:hypothetical protein